MKKSAKKSTPAKRYTEAQTKAIIAFMRAGNGPKAVREKFGMSHPASNRLRRANKIPMQNERIHEQAVKAKKPAAVKAKAKVKSKKPAADLL